MNSLSYHDGLSRWNAALETCQVIVPAAYHAAVMDFYFLHMDWRWYGILCYQGDRLVALLPVIDTKRALHSQPHFSYGGWLPLLTNGPELPDPHGWLPRLRRLKPGYYEVQLHESPRRHEKRPLQIRSLYPQRGLVVSHKAVSWLELPDRYSVFRKTFSKNLQRKLSKAESMGFTVETGQRRVLDDFYDVYLKNIRHLGSMPYSRDFFNDLLTVFHENDLSITVIRHEGKTVAAAMMMHCCGFFENMFFATDTEYRKYYVGDFLHQQLMWWSMRIASKDGPTKKTFYYSFGRSTIDSGVYHYKNHWPVSNHPLYVTPGTDIRQHGLLTSLWDYFPWWLKKYAGTRLIKHLY